MKKSLLIVTFTLTLTACTGTAQTLPAPAASEGKDLMPPPARLAQAADTPRTTLPIEALTAPGGEEALPRVPLTRELMFRILAAEIAFQRGDWQSAYATTLDLAKQTRDPRLARRAAEFAHLSRQQPHVLAAVRLWRELAPDSEEANQYYLGFVLMGDNLDEARPLLTERLKQASPQGRIALAFQYQRMLLRAPDKEAAFKLLEQVLAPYLETPEIRLALSQAALAAGNLERAREEARTALSAKPDSELAILSLAQATPDKNEALALIADFLEDQPQSREVRLAHARLLIDQQAYDKASKEFEVLLKDDPQDLTSLYALGVLGVQTGKFDSAESYLLRYLDALDENPDLERDPTQAMLLLAQIAEERQDTDSLLKWLSRIDSGEAYVQAQVRRAQIMAKRGEFDAARELLIKVEPGSERDEVLLISAEAQLLREAGQLDEAMEVFEDGLKRMPDNTDLLYDYAMLAEKNGALEQMEKLLRRIMEIAPEHHHAYNALGYSLADRNMRLDEARALIRKALEMAPEDAFIIDSMGWVEYRLGNLEDAERWLRRAYALRPDVEIAAHLGEVLWVKGDREAALRLWREAQAKDPQNDTLKSTLARLNATP